MELVAHDITVAKLSGDMLNITTPVHFGKVFEILRDAGYLEEWRQNGCVDAMSV